ncbi:MAG: orotidine-5'-phosphate decarboxylase [Candidatus Omnitrophota bacterium]|nr:orotidine-5'-phosphate decarboxylase [Candidatus Omnitrophota bacterium]
MQDIKEKIIVALDVDTLKEAERFVDLLISAGIKYFKVGSQLFTAYGPDAVRMVSKAGAKVFLDLKFHDIPNTVALASGSTASILSVTPSAETGNIAQDIRNLAIPAVFMMTVHIKGGRKMLEAAVKGAEDKARELKIKRPLVVGVTRLTSDEDKGNIQHEVTEAARLAKSSGLDGVVCSAHEVSMVRNEFGQEFIIVVPGIRPKGAQADDQSRVATAREAIDAGASYLVIGRPILKAPDPIKAFKELIS